MRSVTRIAAWLGGAALGALAVLAALAMASALFATLATAAGNAAASANGASAPSEPTTLDAAPVEVTWQLDVLRDGQTIDTFQATTMVGQSYGGTHHHETTHRVGCKNQPAGGIDLARTVSVSPVTADIQGVTLAIDADETIEDDTAPTTSEGCALPPQPRRVNASHPGLLVPIGGSADWTLIDKNPTLVYRVHASVTSH